MCPGFHSWELVALLVRLPSVSPESLLMQSWGPEALGSWARGAWAPSPSLSTPLRK